MKTHTLPKGVPWRDLPDRHGPRMINIFGGQIQLIGMVFHLAAIFGAAICQDAQQRDLMFIEEWHYLIIDEIGSGDRRFFGV